MRKIVILAVLMMAVTNCSYFSELNDIAENEKKSEDGNACIIIKGNCKVAII